MKTAARKGLSILLILAMLFTMPLFGGVYAENLVGNTLIEFIKKPVGFLKVTVDDIDLPDGVLNLYAKNSNQ